MLSKFLFRNLKGYRFLIVIAILMAIAQVGSDILSALSLKFIVSKVGNPGNDPACQFPFLNGPLSLFDSPLFDRSLQGAPGQPPKMPPVSPCPISISRATTQHSVIGVIIFSLIMLIVFGALSAIMIYVERLLASSIGQNLTARLRRQLFEHLQRLSLDWHGKQKKGDLVQRVIGNIADIEKLVTDGVVDLLAGSLTLVGVAIIMYVISPQYTLLSLAIAPALFMIALTYTKSIKAAAKKAAKAEGQVANVATEDIGALTVIKVFTREDREAMRFAKYVGNKREAGLRASGLQAQFTPIVAILVALGTAIVVGVGGYVAAGNTFNVGFFTIPAEAVDIGVLVVFLTYLKMLYQPMKDLSKLFPLASSAGSGAERIQEVLDQAPEVTEPTGPYYGPQKFKGDIQFENVVFGYTTERPILKGINLHIPAGRKIALVGLSGGGKTTLVKLIPRFYEIQQGSVKVDGADNRLYPLSVLRQNVSMVLQDSVLFEGTIRENIEIGRPGASMEEIVEAAKQAHIHDTIMGMADKYDTMVREQGKNFSGGQRQRLAIARAILRDAPILVLDEPTASLDVEAEAEVMRALDQLVVNRTVLMISHRLSTLGSVDEIIVLKDGRIVEQGTFKELKRRNGVFAGLLDEQNRYNVEREGEKSILRSAFVPRPGSYDQVQVPSPQRPPVVPPTPVVPRSPQPGPSPIPVAPAPAQWNKVDGQQVQPVKGNGPQPAASPQNARVVIEVDGKVVGEHELNKPVLTVGRLSGNDVQVPSQRVSRLHAKIRWEDSTWVIEDAESLNGLVYQGHRVDRLILSNGDRIHVAPTAVIQYKTTP